MRQLRGLSVFVMICLIVGCESGPPVVPYPAFVSVDELPDIFIAGLPGVRAKPLTGASGDTAGGGYRIDLPSSWQGTSGAIAWQDVGNLSSSKANLASRTSSSNEAGTPTCRQVPSASN